VKSATVFYPSAPWTRLADRFKAYQVQRGRDLDRLGLTERERAVVCLFLGLDGIAPHLQRDIADALGLTKQRIRQLLGAALRKVERGRYPIRSE
jgi:DNA-directed RNA polymerase sigma subunit (sigma70/sigma32)